MSEFIVIKQLSNGGVLFYNTGLNRPAWVAEYPDAAQFPTYTKARKAAKASGGHAVSVEDYANGDYGFAADYLSSCRSR